MSPEDAPANSNTCRDGTLERNGAAIRFHPTLLGFAGHYRYEPRPIAVARGNEKGPVERAFRYVRDSFFAARSFVDLDDLNAQAETWCIGPAADRRCPDEPQRTVRAVFAEEAGRLLALLDNPAPLARAGGGLGRQDPLKPPALPGDNYSSPGFGQHVPHRDDITLL